MCMVTPTIPSDESNTANASRVRGNTSTTDSTVHLTASVDAQQTAETIKGIARRIREESIRMRRAGNCYTPERSGRGTR